MPHEDRDRRLWLFNSLEFSGNPKWLFHYVVTRRPDIDAYWIADTEEKAQRVRELGYRAVSYRGRRSLALQRRAGVYVVDQVKERIPAAMSGIAILNLWHGVGVKRVERLMTTGGLLPVIARKYIRNTKIYRDTQSLLVTSPMMEEHFRQQIGFSESQVIRAGYPRNEYLRQYGPMRTFDHDLRGRKSLPADTRIILYAPTYRLSGNEEFFSTALPDLDALAERLEEQQAMLILKMHPRLERELGYQLAKARFADHPRFLFWEPRDDVYEIFDQIDTAIVDYSSIHYDLVAAGVASFIRYVYDHGEAEALEPGMDYFALSTGTIATSFAELLDALAGDNAAPADELTALHDAFWAYAGTPIDDIVEHALGYRVVDTELPTLYSYDVFDTVIHRRTVLPRGIFWGVQQLAAASGDYPGHLVERFVEVRVQAEAALREARRKDPEHARAAALEVTLAQIYERIGLLYGLADRERERLQAWEVELEVAASLPDEEMVAEIAARLAAGDRVILISDMYLPREAVVEILRAADPVLASLPIYLSSEWGVQKASKWLYIRAFVEERLDYAAWVHTGDNPHTDIRMAAALGIRTVARRTPRFDERETWLVNSLRSYDGHLLAGLIRDLRMAGAEPIELFVHRTVALHLVPYVAWLLDDAMRRGYRTIYFIARDGHHLHRIAEALIEELDLPIRARYVFGSRWAWRLASQLEGLDPDTFRVFGSFSGISTFDGLVRASRLTEAELLDLVPSLAEYRGVRYFDGRVAARIRASLAASPGYRRRLEQFAAEDRELVTAYFEQELDLTEPFAFADYWARGYTQDQMARILRHMAGEELVVPFYYARSIYPGTEATPRHDFTAAGASMLHVEALFANLPYGTTLGYRRGDDGVEPVTEPRRADAALLAAMESLLPEFARRYARLPVLDRDRLNRDAFRAAVEHFRVKQEHPEYQAFIAPLPYSGGLGEEEHEFAPRFTLPLFLDYLRRRPSGQYTNSFRLTLARSRGLIPRLIRLQRDVGFRRNILRARRRARAALRRLRLRLRR